MIIVFAGLHGTGKSTIARKVAEAFGYTYYATGNVFRDLAKEKNMSLEEFSKYSETHPEVDIELDNRIKEMAQSGKDYTFDGQMPPYLLGDLANLKILLKCNDDVRIRRMMQRDQRDFEAQKHETLVREASERQRFIDLYHVDIHDPVLIKHTFDFVVDCTQMTIDEVFQFCLHEIITRFPQLKAKLENKN
jgi:cytidylate kinase